MKEALGKTIDRIRSLCLFVRQESPHLIYRLEPADKIEPGDPGFYSLLAKIYRALGIDREVKDSEIVDLWPLDLWEYNQKEYDYFTRHPEEFSGFSECGVARILSHIALTLDLGGPAYLFVMYNMETGRVDLRSEIPREDYESLLEELPF
ncbi:MAG: hypothetical protein JRH07_07920 [Deltaproteobacteria bacterium]|nr:hypothetical protein [Deltaproteobacteria bacterium]MBW2121756.1 hypothetical protein [Deltaproteobacteria bacterium]